MRRWIPPAMLDLYRRVQRRRLDRRAGSGGASPPLQSRSPADLFDGIEGVEVAVPGSRVLLRDSKVLPLTELLILAAIVRHVEPETVFEFGTYTGASTLVMAMNAGEGARIHTLDLPPAGSVERQGGEPATNPVNSEIGSAYRGTAYERKVRQHYGDAAAFDPSPLTGSVDLVFIDAGHAYDSVERDTRNALIMLRSGGTIVWDDYVGTREYPDTAGVARFVNEFSKSRRCHHIEGTRLAVYTDS